MGEDYYPNFYWQMKAQLVREIRDAQTWSNKVDACNALMNVNMIGESMANEAKHLSGDNMDAKTTNSKGE